MASNFHDEPIFYVDDTVLEETGFRNMISASNVFARQTRPSIAASVGILSQFLVKSTKFVNSAVKRVFAYLNRTARYSLSIFITKNSQTIHFFFHSDYAGNKFDRNRDLPGLDSVTTDYSPGLLACKFASRCLQQNLSMIHYQNTALIFKLFLTFYRS